ncbi:MAG: hypothetical protein Q9219_006543 [cf. Caloplaca sp. 3 TL-2023]
MDWSERQPIFEQPLRSGIPSNLTLRLRHPGYPDLKNTLFLFNAYDHQDGGIRKSLALTACAIVAGNTWHGYLSCHRTGPPVVEGIDEVLVGKTFYFHNHIPLDSSELPDACPCITQPYPIYTDFASWPFPHGNLPAWWPSIDGLMSPTTTISDISLAIKARDLSCRITGSVEAGETAHVVAVRENTWFEDQNMFEYSDDIRFIHSCGNQILLRCDLHRTYDQFKWVIFPHRLHYVYYALDGSIELASLYHQRELRSIRGVKAEYLLAAFARAIFPKLSEFLRSRIDKYLVGVSVSNHGPGGVLKDGAWCADHFRIPGSSRNPSPTKRASPSKEGGESPRKRTCNENATGESSRKRSQPSSETVTSSPGASNSGGSASKRLKHGYRDPRHAGPCTCLQLPQTPSASSICAESEESDIELLPPRASVFCLSDRCRNRIELNRLDRLRSAALQQQRSVSNPDGTWNQHLEWAKDPAAVQDVSRWLWVHGQELRNDDE